MIAWLLVVTGAVLAAGGILSGVATLQVRRVDLYRWSAGTRRGHGAAGTLLAMPERILRTANALVSLGCLLVGAGVAVVLEATPAPIALIGVSLVAVPLVLAIAVSVPRSAAERAAEAVIPTAVPILARAAVVLAPLTGTRPPPSPRELPGAGDELGVLSGVDAFTQRPVREVMTPRTEIVAVREGTPIEEVARVFASSGYSRIAVYRENLDNVIGMTYAFDLLKIAPGADLPIRPVATAPASKRSAELLFEMQRERRHLAVVLDEFGGTAGIVTMDDLLEELVAEIFDEDETAAAAPPAQLLLSVPGTNPVSDIAVRFGVELPRVSETVGGLLASLAGRIPHAGERFGLAGLEFDVVAATHTRIDRVLIRRGPVRVTPLGSEVAR